MIGVVIPAYRPDETILQDYVEAIQAVVDPAVVRIEFDDPVNEALVDALSHRSGVTVNATRTRRGKGAAVTAGFEAVIARDDIRHLAFVDADGSTPAEELAALTDRLIDTGADLCIGSRRHPEATVTTHQTTVRRHLGDAFVALANAALPVSLTDYQCGAKAITTEAWQAIRPYLYRSGFDWDLELIAVAAALNRRIVEQPITWADHPASTVRPVQDGITMLVGVGIARHRYAVCREGTIHSTLHRLVPTGQPLVDRV